MSGASERANGRATDPVLSSRFLFVPDHSAWVKSLEGFYQADVNGDMDGNTNYLTPSRRFTTWSNETDRITVTGGRTDW